MATPQSPVHGLMRPHEVLAPLVLTGLVFLHLWELPRLAAQYGGLAFVAIWALFTVLVGLPLVMTALMLGRRSRRSPVEGMAFLTREADAPRYWRAAAWGSLALSVLALPAVALTAGGHLNFLAQDLRLVEAATLAASQSGLVLPLGSGGLLMLAAGMSLLAPARRRLFLVLGLLLVLVLLAMAALAGSGAAIALYAPAPLTAEAWRAALGLAFCGSGVGAGLLWMAGVQTPRESSLARFGVAAVLGQLLAGVLLLLALAPFVAALRANSDETGWQILPTGPAVWLLLAALVLGGLLALQQLAEPALAWLAERKLAALPAVALVFGSAGLLTESLWFAAGPDGLQSLLRGLALLLLLVVLGLLLFSGWAMKISHARKELQLPNEGLYNLWRVAVRLALPLALLWVLIGMPAWPQ